MAIFRAETKHISRSKNHNVVAAAAYRSGEKLTDTNSFNPDAKTYDYTKKQGILATGIILPNSLIDQNFTINRQQLWSSVEQHETTTRSVKGSRLKQSARLAREWLLALPHELSDEENEQLTAEFTQKLVDDLGVIGDYCIHKPTVKNYKPKADYIESYDPDGKLERTRVYDVEATEPDNRNIHAHIMFTTRKVTLDNGSLAFGEKADSERSELWRQEQKLANGGDYIKEIRQLWADMINQRLEQKHILPITAKSYQDLGMNIIPQHKQGKNASTLVLYDFEPPIVGFNNDIKERNKAYLESTADRCLARESREAEPSYRRAEQAADSIKAAGEWLSGTNNSLAESIPRAFDRESSVESLNRQTILFNQLAERATSVIAEPSGVLIKKAVRQYLAIVEYENLVKRPNPKRKHVPIDPYQSYNERQIDIVKHIYAHIKGLKEKSTSYSYKERAREAYSSFDLEESLKEPINKHLLILLTDPIKEQKKYVERKKAFDELMANRERTSLIRNVENESPLMKTSEPLDTSPAPNLKVNLKPPTPRF